MTDGSVVVAGFGDNSRAFWSRAPAGVAAYRLSDGHHLWTAFESNSVMSGAVIAGDRVVYATAAGRVVSRDLGTGRMVTTTTVPGSVQMAPPALADSILVLAVGRDAVCALSVATLRTLWCRRYPGALNTDAAAPAVIGTTIVQSASEPISAHQLFGQWRRLGSRLFATVFWDVLRGRSNRSAGQVLLGIDLASGNIKWTDAEFPAKRSVPGHISGTAAGADGTGVVALPIADAIVAFRVADGHVLWQAPGESTRGPVLIVDSTVYVFTASGAIRTLDLRDGRTTCRYTTSYRFDRAGPALTGRLLLAGSITGDLLALPLDPIDRCEPFVVSGIRFMPASVGAMPR